MTAVISINPCHQRLLNTRGRRLWHEANLSGLFSHLLEVLICQKLCFAQSSSLCGMDAAQAGIESCLRLIIGSFRSWIIFPSTYRGSIHLTFPLVSPVMGTCQGASCLQSCVYIAQGTADGTEKEAPFSVLVQILENCWGILPNPTQP